MKFDAAGFRAKIQDPADLRQQMDLQAKDKILVAGSTHPQEDEIILGAYKDLLLQFHGLKLIIAPRHPERSREISKIASRFGFRGVVASEFPFKCDGCIESPVFIIDIIGRLFSFYSIADIVFVGGSLVKKGGQNILEPASLSKPVIFGPFMFNFRDIADLFLSNDAAIMIRNQQELKTSIAYFLNNFTRALEMGERAKQLIEQNQGATGKTIEWVRTLL
jgi:3-deoxy-D-manno-octulosonic-acid transferase